MRQTTDVFEQGVDARSRSYRDQLAAGSEFALGIKFPVRTKCDFQMMNITGRSSPTAFRDVRRNRNGRFAHLIGQSEALARWEGFCDVVNHVREVHRLLPRDKVAEARDLGHANVLARSIPDESLLTSAAFSLIPNPQSLIPDRDQ